MGPHLQQVDRVFVRHRGRRLAYFGGCDYFRLASHPTVLAAVREALAEFGLNVAASRATTGNHALYGQLETALARFFGVESAVLVPSGYATNGVVAQALAGEITHALMDAHAHASLVDAAVALGCPVMPFRHRDPSDLADRVRQLGRSARPLVLTDGLYARAGSIAPLDAYLEVLPARTWLLVDDAHGAGVLGRRGRGTPEFCGVRPPRLIQTCTLSKAFGTYGGAILTTRSLAERIRAQSRPFAGSTPLPLPLAAGALAAVALLRNDGDLRRRLAVHTTAVKTPLHRAGLSIQDTPCPVVSVKAPNDRAAVRFKRALVRRGIFPSFIRYPGGPAEGYFRFSISSEHTSAQLDDLVAALLACPGLAAVDD